MKRWMRASAVFLIGAAISGDLRAQLDLDALAERARVRHPEVPRKVLAFYYTWYGNPGVAGGSGRWFHWEGVSEAAKTIDSSASYPALGAYDSHDPKLIDKHCEWARRAGVDGFIATWWGRGDFTDTALVKLLDGCRKAGLEATIYYETVPRPRTPAAAVEDLLYVLERHGGHPAWLKAAGKPVIFIYSRAVEELGLGGWLEVIREVNRRHAPGVMLIGDQIGRGAALVFDGIHTYNPLPSLAGKDPAGARSWARAAYPAWIRTAAAPGRIGAVTVIPGYDDTKVRRPGLRLGRFGGELYRAQWEEAIAACPDWVLITSWNEWHEGSEIEPSVEDGDKYLDLTTEFSKRFKKAPRREPPKPGAEVPRPSAAETAALREKWRGIGLAVFPDPESNALWWLIEAGLRPEVFGRERFVDEPPAPDRFPVLLYASGERYRRSVRSEGDVDRALLGYLRAGGFLIALPSLPMPFHYDEEGRTVAAAARFGLPLSISGPDGGWEVPPLDAKLELARVGDALRHLPERFPFPAAGDPRWRPWAASRLAAGDEQVILLDLRDGAGRSLGAAAAYAERRGSEPRGAKVLYAWFGLLDHPLADLLLHDLFDFAAGKVRKGPAGR